MNIFVHMHYMRYRDMILLMKMDVLLGQILKNFSMYLMSRLLMKDNNK
jgi:hypothetical protein